MKKMFSLVLALSLLLSLSTTGYAAVNDDCNNITIDVSEEHFYYDEELGTNHSWQTGSCGQEKCHTASWHRQKYSRTTECF